MKKNAITPAAAAGVHQCAAIMRPHMSQPAVEAWISKGLALADDIAQPTAGANGWTEPVTKADAQLEESLNELAELRKRDDLSLTRGSRYTRYRRALGAYFRKESPAAAAAVEAARRGEAPAPDGGVAAKAERLAEGRASGTTSSLRTSPRPNKRVSRERPRCWLIQCRVVALPVSPTGRAPERAGVSPRVASRVPSLAVPGGGTAGNLPHVRSSGSCHRPDS